MRGVALSLAVLAAVLVAAAAVAEYSVVDYGARPDGGSDSAGAFLAAWAAACGHAGRPGSRPVMRVPAGRFLLSKAYFKGPCRSAAGVVVAIDGTVFAPLAVDSTAWIMFHYADGLAIRGGTLDGQGRAHWACKADAGRDCPPGTTVSPSYFLFADAIGFVSDGPCEYYLELADAGHQPVEWREREAGDAVGQQERAHVHLRLQGRDGAEREDRGAGGQPQHRRHPRAALQPRAHPQRHHRHRRRLRLHGARHLRRAHPEHQVRPRPRDQHREPGRGGRRGGREERDGGEGGADGHAERPADQDLGEAQPRVRDGGHLLPGHHARRAQPHRRRPELLPRRRQMPRQEFRGADQRRVVRGHRGHVGDAGGGEVRLQRQQPVHRVQAQQHQPHVPGQDGAVPVPERRRVRVRSRQPAELPLT